MSRKVAKSLRSFYLGKLFKIEKDRRDEAKVKYQLPITNFMFKQNKSAAPQRDRDGLTSYILLQQGDISTDNLAITWVDVAPGCSQRPHSHAPEQVYVIISGQGRMRVGDEERDVVEGDLVYIPSNVVHSIVNLSNEVLRYISASTPAFDLQALYDTGKLKN
jgi:mannose-6-phosphate isomerase-like protein (cupin superfamily)